jgi:hypothetical protein
LIEDYFVGRIAETPVESDWRVPHQADMDVREMFLNYMLHHSERHAFGIRLASGEEPNISDVYKCFCQLMCGGTPCPYLAVQGHARALEGGVNFY